MIQPIVESRDFVTILGPSHAKPEDIDEVLHLAPVLVAADGAAVRAKSLGHTPDAVIGDFDSIPANLTNDLPDERLHRIEEQNTTDFEKCLTRISARLCLAVGFTGRRLDHELAVMNTLVRHTNRRCILIGSDDIVFAATGEVALDLPRGSRFSLFPLAPVSATSSGLVWPVDQVQFDPAGKIGTSNEVSGPVRLVVDQPGMLVILPRAALAEAIRALTGAPSSVRGQ
jgi:thiamine pyrophosphokinase